MNRPALICGSEPAVSVTGVSRYDIGHVEIFEPARKHNVSGPDIQHVVDHALVVAEGDDDKVLCLGPDRAGNLLEIVSVFREDGTEIVIHAMRMRRTYEPLLRETGNAND